MRDLKIFTDKIKGQDIAQNQIYGALQKERLPHALLFSGPSGVGKKSLAWDLAQSLLCEKTSYFSNEEESLSLDLLEEESSYRPCSTCPSCQRVLKRESEAVLEIKHETLQIRLQDVKLIPSFLSLQSFSKCKIVFIDSAEKLNLQASNFLLKMIEEPPPRSFFFLISSQASQISITIRSRLQNIRLRTLEPDLLKDLNPSETVSSWMIQGARGRLDLLLELQEKGSLRQEAFELFLESFNKRALEINFSSKIKDRKTALDFLYFWRQFLRDIRLLKEGLASYIIHGDKKDSLEKLAHCSKEQLDFLLGMTLKMENELKANFDYTLCFENFVILLRKSLKESWIGLNSS